MKKRPGRYWRVYAAKHPTTLEGNPYHNERYPLGGWYWLRNDGCGLSVRVQGRKMAAYIARKLTEAGA